MSVPCVSGRDIHIPDAAEQIYDKCFCTCKSLSHVPFGGSSSLRFIGKDAFHSTGVIGIHVPVGVEKLLRDAFPDSTLILGHDHD